MFHTYIAFVSSRCCICSAMTTHVFPSCFRRILQEFQLFRTYVANVSSRCCKNGFGVAHVAVGPICSNCWARLHSRGCGGSVRGIPCERRSRRSGAGYGAACAPTWSNVGVRRGRPDASPRPDVRALALGVIYYYDTVRKHLISYTIHTPIHVHASLWMGSLHRIPLKKSHTTKKWH